MCNTIFFLHFFARYMSAVKVSTTEFLACGGRTGSGFLAECYKAKLQN